MQARNKIAVEFDDVETRNFADQLTCEHAFAGTDFDDVVRGFGVEGGDDALNNPALVQEVLAEALTGFMRNHKDPNGQD